jgi:hypothetical protein
MSSNIKLFYDKTAKLTNDTIYYWCGIRLDPNNKKFLKNMKEITDIILSVEQLQSSANSQVRFEKCVKLVSNELARKMIHLLIEDLGKYKDSTSDFNQNYTSINELYTAQGGYPTPTGYTTQGGYPAPTGYTTQGGYPVGTGYTTQGGFTTQGGYPTPTGYPAQGYPDPTGYPDTGYTAPQVYIPKKHVEQPAVKYNRYTRRLDSSEDYFNAVENKFEFTTNLENIFKITLKTLSLYKSHCNINSTNNTFILNDKTITIPENNYNSIAELIATIHQLASAHFSYKITIKLNKDGYIVFNNEQATIAKKQTSSILKTEQNPEGSFNLTIKFTSNIGKILGFGSITDLSDNFQHQASELPVLGSCDTVYLSVQLNNDIYIIQKYLINLKNTKYNELFTITFDQNACQTHLPKGYSVSSIKYIFKLENGEMYDFKENSWVSSIDLVEEIPNPDLD